MLNVWLLRVFFTVLLECTSSCRMLVFGNILQGSVAKPCNVLFFTLAYGGKLQCSNPLAVIVNHGIYTLGNLHV